MAGRDAQGSPAPETLWLAAGAAIAGVLLGGAAVWLGLQSPRPVEVPSPPVVATAQVPELPPQAPPSETRCIGTCANGSGLVEAVAATRDLVVTLRLKDTIGAGVVVDESGLVLTNFHVIASDVRDRSRRVLLADEHLHAGEIRARFADGRELPAVVAAADREQDIALLRLRPADSAERFPATRIGRSSGLQVGETVFSVGTPLGLDHSVSQGIISALGRTNILRNKQTPLIQLNASINIGNSGGPLFNMQGELVGITTATIERAQGIAFAIPIDHIYTLLRALNHGDFARSSQIGVEVDPRVPISQAARDRGYRNGVVIKQVFPGLPAEAAGLQVGDILVEARGQRFDAYGDGSGARQRLAQEFVRMVRGLIPGETLEVTVMRGDTRLPVALVVVATPQDRQVFIDAEELLGLRLGEDSEEPVVAGLGAMARWRGSEVLLNARITAIAGVPTPGIAELGAVLAELRQLGREGTVAIKFVLKDGRDLPIADFPMFSP